MSDAPEATPAAETVTPAAIDHPDVRAMENALTRGDFQDARDIAKRLAGSDDVALRDAGRAMLARFELDPRVLGALAFTGALLVALAAIYLGRH